MIVHCSAGIGRSGTFCAVHSTVEKFKLDLENNPHVEPTVSLVNTVLYMRKQRPGMVQTKEQFMFCYLAIREEIERLFQQKKLELQEKEKEQCNGKSSENNNNEKKQ